MSLKDKLDSIKLEKDTKIVAGNIKKDVEILGVTGTYTSDATAITSDILSTKTAYVDGVKLTGTLSNITKKYGSTTEMNAEQNTIDGMYGLIKPLVTQETYTDYAYTANMNNMYYGGEGFYALRVLNSFVASSEITTNFAATFLCLDAANISVGNIFIRATTAAISVTDGTNNYLNAQYTSSDGINYTLSSVTGDNYNATTGIANFSDVYGAIYTGKNQGGEPTPIFTAQLADFLKPVTVIKTTVEGDATALYQYNNSWNELLDKYKNNIYVQTTAPSTFAGIWIKSNSFTYTNVREITDESAVVASNINILVNPNSAHNYKTIMVDSNIVNGMHYEFDAVYCTDSNGDILYDSPEVYYGNGTQWVDITPQSYEIVPFATATDEQISKLLNAHYAGAIDLSTIWNIGDTRVIHINALSAPVAGSNRPHMAQDMTFRIIGFNHDTLTTAINAATKAAVTIECKEVIAIYNSQYYSSEDDFLSCNSNGLSYENPVYWDNAYRRTWLNTDFVNALPSTFNTLIKEVVKGNLQGHDNTTSIVSTNDKAFFLSYPEVFGQTTFADYRRNSIPGNYEGTQYAYYVSGSAIKYYNNNGSASSNVTSWSLRSPSSLGVEYWVKVGTDGSAGSNYESNRLSLAPALAI